MTKRELRLPPSICDQIPSPPPSTAYQILFKRISLPRTRRLGEMTAPLFQEEARRRELTPAALITPPLKKSLRTKATDETGLQRKAGSYYCPRNEPL